MKRVWIRGRGGSRETGLGDCRGSPGQRRQLWAQRGGMGCCGGPMPHTLQRGDCKTHGAPEKRREIKDNFRDLA